MLLTISKNAIFKGLGSADTCYIALGLLDVSEDNLKDADGKEFTGVVVFTKPNVYKYEEEYAGIIACS